MPRLPLAMIPFLAALALSVPGYAFAGSSLSPETCFDPANMQVIRPAGGGRIERRRIDRDTVVIVLTGPIGFICAGPASGDAGSAEVFHVNGVLSVSYFGAGRKRDLGGAVIGLYSDVPRHLDLRDVSLLMSGSGVGGNFTFIALHLGDAFVGQVANRGASPPSCDAPCDDHIYTNATERNLRPTLIALCPWPGEAIEVKVRHLRYIDNSNEKRR